MIWWFLVWSSNAVACDLVTLQMFTCVLCSLVSCIHAQECKNLSASGGHNQFFTCHAQAIHLVNIFISKPSTICEHQTQDTLSGCECAPWQPGARGSQIFTYKKSLNFPIPSRKSLNRGVPAAGNNEPALAAVLDALDRTLMGPMGTLCTRVDVERLQDVVKATRPHMNWVLGQRIVSFFFLVEKNRKHLKCTVQDWHGMGVGAARRVAHNVIQAHFLVPRWYKQELGEKCSRFITC